MRSSHVPVLTLVCLAAAGLGAPPAARAQDPDPRELFERAYFQEHALKQLEQAIASYERVAALAAERDPALAGKALLRVAQCEQARGRDVEARRKVEQVLARFGEVPEVAREARALLGATGAPRRTLRVHDVSFLLTAIEDAPAPAVRLVPDTGRLRARRLFERPAAPSGGGSAGGSFSFDDGGEDAPAGRGFDPDQLVELIQRNVDEDSWANDRNSLEIQGGQLVVVQTAAVHAELERYLERLRAQRGRLVTCDVTLALVDGALARAVLDDAAGGPLPEARAQELEERLLAGRGARLVERRRLTAWDRQRVHAALLGEHPYLTWEVDQTGVAPVAGPRLERGAAGVLVEVRPALVGAGDLLLLDLELAAARWAHDAVEARIGALGPDRRAGAASLHLPRADVFALSTRLLLRPGATAVAGGARVDLPPEGPAPEGLTDARLLVLVRPTVSALATGQADAERPAPSAPRVLRMHDVSLVTGLPRAGVDGEEGLTCFCAGHDDEERVGLDMDTIVELLTRNVAPESWDGAALEVAGEGLLAVVQTPEVHAQIDAFLATLRRERGRALQLEVALVDLPPGEQAALLARAQAAGAGAHALPAALAAPLLAGDRVRGWQTTTAWAGEGAALLAATQRAALTGFSLANGGTGAVVETVVLPIVEHGEDGHDLVVRAGLLPDGKHVRLRLAGWLRAAGLGEVVGTPHGPIALPRRVERRLAADVVFPLDHVLVLGASSGAAPGLDRGLLVVRARARDLLAER